MERLRAYRKDATGRSPESRTLWEELQLLAKSAPKLESRMAREYEVSERTFDLPVSEQGVLARLARLLSGLREGDEAEARGEPGEVQRVRGVINAARIKDRYGVRSVNPGMTPERAIARLQEDVYGLSAGFGRLTASANAYTQGYVQRVCVPGQDKMGAWTRTVGIDEHTSSQRGRQSTRSQTSNEADVLRQAGKRSGMGHHLQRGQLHRLRPGGGAHAGGHGPGAALTVEGG